MYFLPAQLVPMSTYDEKWHRESGWRRRPEEAPKDRQPQAHAQRPESPLLLPGSREQHEFRQMHEQRHHCSWPSHTDGFPRYTRLRPPPPRFFLPPHSLPPQTGPCSGSARLRAPRGPVLFHSHSVSPDALLHCTPACPSSTLAHPPRWHSAWYSTPQTLSKHVCQARAPTGIPGQSDLMPKLFRGNCTPTVEVTCVEDTAKEKNASIQKQGWQAVLSGMPPEFLAKTDFKETGANVPQ